MASIKKRPNGKWQARIYIGRDADGKQMFECVTMDSWHECKAAAREIELEVEKSNYVLSSIRKTKVVDQINKWIELKRPELSPSTIALYKIYLNAHYTPFFKNATLGQVAGNEMLIREFKSELLGKLHPNTVRKILSVLNKIFRESLRDKNPCKYVELPKKIKPKRKVPNNKEFEQIHEAIRGTIDEPIALLAAWCGLRLGEICAIKPNDVYREKGIIRVDEALAINDEYEWEFKEPKSDNGIRDIKVPQYLMDLIWGVIVKKGEIPERVFDYLPSSYSHRWTDIIRKKKLPKVTFHSLRHYHASWLYKMNIPDQYAAHRLGHDIQTLKGIYQHLGLDMKLELDDKIAEMLPGQIEEEKKETHSN